MKRSVSILFAISFLIIATISAFVPFYGKAFHIDDPLFIWTAKQIQSHPWDPYGFNLVWYYTRMGMWKIAKNPPLTSYIIALAAYIFGWSDKSMHLIFIVPAILAIMGTYLLARRMCRSAIFAGLISLLTPVFLISGTNIMSDMMMMAFWVWALLIWMRGIEKDKPILLALSAALVCLCAIAKYFGLVLIPILFIYAFAKKRNLRQWIFYLFIPAAVLVLYEWWTKTVYGYGLLLDSSGYAMDFNLKTPFGLFVKGLMGLSYLGGSLASLAFYIPFLWSKRTLALQAVSLGVLILFFPLLWNIKGFSFSDSGGVGWPLVAQFSIFVFIGINVLALAAADILRNRKSAEALTLFSWFTITYIFASFLNWCVNGRSILPIVPAAAMLLARRIETRLKTFERRALPLLVLLVPAGILSFSVAWADYKLANTSKKAASMICAKYKKEGKDIWFQGHWGFQYYMQLNGGRPAEVDRASLQFRPADILVVPENNCNTFPLAPDMMVTVLETLEFNEIGYCSTMNHYLGAGFYSNVESPLPFVFGKAPSEKYHILRLEPWSYLAQIQTSSKPIVQSYNETIEGYTRTMFSLYDPRTVMALKRAYINRANIYMHVGERKKAISDYTQALIINPYDKKIADLRSALLGD